MRKVSQTKNPYVFLSEWRNPARPFENVFEDSSLKGLKIDGLVNAVKYKTAVKNKHKYRSTGYYSTKVSCVLQRLIITLIYLYWDLKTSLIHTETTRHGESCNNQTCWEESRNSICTGLSMIYSHLVHNDFLADH